MMTAEQYKEMWAGMDKPARNSYINALRERRPQAAQYAEVIRTLYYREYGKKIGGCINCLLSAHFDIINGQIKGLKYMENKETKGANNAKYALRPGVVLYDRANRDVAKIATKDNLTDELAMYHLASNPVCLKHFTKYPENWKEEVTAYAKANKIESPFVRVEPANAADPNAYEGAKESGKPETDPKDGGKGEPPIEEPKPVKEGKTALSEAEKEKLAKQYEQTPVAKTGRPSEK